MEVYKNIPCLMWEEQARLHGSFTLSAYWKEFYLHLETLFGRGWSLLLIGVICLRHLLLPDRKKLLRTILLFFLMSTFWFVVFVQHTADHQWGSTILLFAPFAAFLYGAVLAGLYENFLRQKIPSVRTAGVILITLLLGCLIGGRIRAYRPFQAYPGIQSLEKYRGSYFFSTSIPTLVSAITGTPTGWMAGRHPAQMYFRARFLVNPNCKLQFKPEFFFSPQHPLDPEFSRQFDNWLSANYEVEEKGEYFTIYNLHQPRNPPGPELIGRRRLANLRNKLPRARRARLEGDTQPRRGQSSPEAGPVTNSRAQQIARKIMKLTGITSPPDSETRARLIPVRAVSDNLFRNQYRIYASSYNSPVENLCRADPRKFWHVSMGKVGEPAWAAIDFGENQKKIVNFLRTRPRAGFPSQSFKDSAVQGSRDGKNWEDIAAVIEEAPPTSGEWRGWYFPNNTPYRFYRLFIVDGQEQNGSFYSLGELQLYRVNRGSKN